MNAAKPARVSWVLIPDWVKEWLSRRRAFLGFRFRPPGRFLSQLSNSFKLLRVAARLVQKHSSVVVYIDPEKQSSIVVSQI